MAERFILAKAESGGNFTQERGLNPDDALLYHIRLYRGFDKTMIKHGC